MLLSTVCCGILFLTALTVVNNEILANAISTDGKKVAMPLEYWCYYPDLLLDTVIATCLTHQLIRCHAGQGMLEYSASKAGRYSLGKVQHPHLPAIYEHKQAALAGLRAELRDEGTRYADLVLNCIITLARAEVRWRRKRAG